MSDDAAKSALRDALRERRRVQDADDVAERSAALTGVVLAMPTWRDAGSIAAFVGVRGEPDTWAILDAAWASAKQVWLPVVRPEGLVFVRTRGRAQIVAACFGLLEPVADGPTASLAEIEPAIVLVPGLGFGSDGARIGFGRGYYDRALAPIRGRDELRRVGLCLAPFVDPPEGPIPMAAHDVPMHAVATDTGVISPAVR